MTVTVGISGCTVCEGSEAGVGVGVATGAGVGAGLVGDDFRFTAEIDRGAFVAGAGLEGALSVVGVSAGVLIGVTGCDWVS